MTRNGETKMKMRNYCLIAAPVVTVAACGMWHVYTLLESLGF